MLTWLSRNGHRLLPGISSDRRPLDRFPVELQAFFTFSTKERALVEARRSPALKLGLALHIGLLRMTGRLLDAFRIVPPAFRRHLGSELGVDTPELSSLRTLYGRGRTLSDHQKVACAALGFRWMSEHQRRALVRLLGDEVSRCADRDQLLVFARRWLYEHHLLIVHDRAIRTLIAAALLHLTAETAAGRVSPAQAKRPDEMQAVADALSLLANIVMAWNTARMQGVQNRWANRGQVIPSELIGRIAPTRLESINLRGVFRFPIERYTDQLLPSQTAPKISTTG